MVNRASFSEDLGDQMSIGFDGLFFEVPNDSVANSREESVHDSEKCNVPGLSYNYSSSEDQWGLLNLHESLEMDSFIFSLLEQSMNPPVISLHLSESAQMSVHSSNESWNSSDSFQEYDSIQPFFFSHDIVLPGENFFVPRHHIKPKFHRLDEKVWELVSNSIGFLVSEINLVYLIFTPGSVR